MKYIIPAVLLILGLALGYVAGKNSVKKDVQQADISQPTTTNITRFIHDTIVKKEVIKVPIPLKDTVSLDSIKTDTVTHPLLDTAVAEYISKNDSLSLDTLKDEEKISINSDKKIDSKVLSINYLNTNPTSTSDSLINKMIDVKPISNKTIIVEFWESPLNYSGYKMSKAKLIVYGLNPHFDYQFYAKDGQYFLNFEQIFYQMQETATFKKYIAVDKSIIFND